MNVMVPGLADLIRERCLKMMGHKAYYMRSAELTPAIKRLADDEINDLGPADILRELADAYPRNNGDWNDWIAYRNLFDHRLDTRELNAWCKAVIERAEQKAWAAA